MSSSSNSRRRRSQRRRQSKGLHTGTLRNADWLARLRLWLFPSDGILAGLKRHGNTSWRPADLVWLALCWSWSAARHVTDAFTEAADQCRILKTPSLSTYQGFMKALTRWTAPLMPLLWSILHERMPQIGGGFWRIDGWIPIGFDGSRSTAPRSASAEQACCAPHYGTGMTARYRKKKSRGLRRRRNERNKPQPQEPQAWITLMWHMGLRLPWMWRLGPSNSSERAHVMDMLETEEFPDKTLFTGDAGFVGYPLWSRILDGGYDFLVRVGANTSLLAEWGCVRQAGLVWCWPQDAQKSSRPALRLRLERVRIGQTQVWMLTSVLNRSRLSRKQMTKFYRMRWGIEIEFRGLKQTLDRRDLRCRNAARLFAELHWSLMGMAIAELFALKEQLASAGGDPQRRSLANTMRALRHCLRHLAETPAAGQDLPTRLREAVTDRYVRKSSKRARYRPKNPDKKPLGDPKIRPLTAQERSQLKSTQPQRSAA